VLDENEKSTAESNEATVDDKKTPFTGRTA